MFITSLSASAAKVTFKGRGCIFVFKSLLGNTIVACPADVFATVIKVEF